jgi:hypothetical protein
MSLFILKRIYFLDKKTFLNSLIPTKIIRRTTIKATIGAKIAKTDTKDAVAVSVEDTKLLPKPPVVTVDVARAAAVDVVMTAAVPPPAIMANPQVIIGSKSISVEAITTEPAMVANGMEIVSNKLST